MGNWGSASLGHRAGIVVLAGLGLVVGGCELLLGPTFQEGFPSSSPIASFADGAATVAIDGGETIELTEVAEGAGIDSLFGSDVRWTGAGGWSLRVSGAGSEEGFGMGGAFLTFDLIADGRHWTTFDPTRCIVEIEVADKTAIRGTATCKGVEWYDALGAGVGPGMPEPLDEPKFDAEVTFEAVP